MVAQTPSRSHVSCGWSGGGSWLENGGPLQAGTVASGASSPGVSSLGALSVFLKRNGFSLPPPGHWLSARACEGCPSVHRERSDVHVHTRLRRPPWWGERVQPEPAHCSARLGQLVRQARRELGREHVQRHAETQVLPSRGSRGLWGGMCPREGSQQGERHLGVRGELTAEPLATAGGRSSAPG